MISVELGQDLEAKRWPIAGALLEQAEREEAWKKAGALSFTSWLDQLAAKSGRSSTFLSRSLAAHKYVQQELAKATATSPTALERLPLSAIEELKRLSRRQPDQVKMWVENLISKKKTYRDLAELNQTQSGKAETVRSEQKILGSFLTLATEHWFEKGSLVRADVRIGAMQFDALVADRLLKWIDAVEVKNLISPKNLSSLTQQMIGMAVLVRYLWLVVPFGWIDYAKTVVSMASDFNVNNIVIVTFDVNGLVNYENNNINLESYHLSDTDDNHRNAFRASFLNRLA